MFASAYLLVAHGSRDPRPQHALETLAQQMRKALATPALAIATNQSRDFRDFSSIPVGTACLELQPQPLHQQILDFATPITSLPTNRLSARTAAHPPIYSSPHPPTLHIIPLFLLPGVHVMDDIPAEVAIAQDQLGDRLHLQICPYLGEAAHLPKALIEILSPFQNGRLILMSHGSRRPGGNVPIEHLAQQLGATMAYWSISPSLEDQIMAQLRQGCQEITVFPYILFPAGITDAIAQTLEGLTQRYPQVRFRVLPALSELAPLAQWVVQDLLA